MNRRTLLLASIGGIALGRSRLAALNTEPKKVRIALIGGVKSHGPAQHDFPNGIRLIESLLKQASPFQGAEIISFPYNFPENLSRLDGVTSLVFYFDGVQTPPAPLLEPARIAEIQKLIDAGAGLVCLHQASTVPAGNTSIPMIEWLGAKRNGMFDRTTETVSFKPASPSFPICRGMKPFTYEDEFYPTLIFTKDSKRIIPILRAEVPKEHPADHILAWAYERPGGGRSFGFTGCHYMAAFEQPEVRKMILNAICWTSGLTIPANGISVQTT
jgi:type 1 glutamine amidotransferase